MFRRIVRIRLLILMIMIEIGFHRSQTLMIRGFFLRESWNLLCILWEFLQFSSVLGCIFAYATCNCLFCFPPFLAFLSFASFGCLWLVWWIFYGVFQNFNGQSTSKFACIHSLVLMYLLADYCACMRTYRRNIYNTCVVMNVVGMNTQTRMIQVLTQSFMGHSELCGLEWELIMLKNSQF